MDDPSLVWLLLAAAAGIGGWLLGRQAGRRERPPGSRDYQLGLDHLLHGRLDAALKVLDGVAAGDDDALELQFALGSLFRKRGEVDRATGLHELLVNHQSGSVRERARFELALDFVAAGLFDRAEQRLQQLAAAGPYRVSAQLQLLRLCEIQSDWLGALRLHQELPSAVQRERSAIAAHYLCELVDQALLTGEAGRAADLLDEAGRYAADNPRIAFLRARLADKAGSATAAQGFYQRAGELRPALRASLEEPAAQFRCEECGFDSGAWLWRCPRCYSWDRFAKRG